MAEQFRDFALDTATGDLAWATDGKQPLSVSGVDSIAQEVAVLFATFKGEWFADLEEGIPYIPDLIQDKPTDEQIISILRAAALDVPGVTGIVNLAIVRGADRRATVTGSIVTSTDELAELAAEIEV